MDVPAHGHAPPNREGLTLLHGGGTGTFLITDITMTPASNSIYAVALFLALVSLWCWTKRRRRVSRMVKRAVASLSKDSEG